MPNAAGHLGDVIDIKKDKTKLHVHTEIPVSKRCVYSACMDLVPCIQAVGLLLGFRNLGCATIVYLLATAAHRLPHDAGISNI